MTATFWIPGPLPGMNELIDAAKGAGGRGARYAKLKKQWTDDIWAWAKEARMPKFPGSVRIEFQWNEPNERRDPDNIAAGKKLILDSLVMAGVLKGDGWRYVHGWTDRFFVDALRPGVGVIVSASGAA